MNYMYQQPLQFDKGVGVVLGSFSPLHKGHLDLIYQAKKECDGGALVVVCGYDGDKGCPTMTLKERYQMTRQFFQNDPLVAVYALSDDEMGITMYNDIPNMWNWDKWIMHLVNDVIQLNQQGKNVSKEQFTFYVGEPQYKSDLESRGFKTVLADRSTNPISGTMIRENPIKYWEDIAWTFHRKFSHNILVTGTASEGKTTLVEDIGRYFNIPYSYEWARGYIEKHCIGDWEFDCRDFVAFLNGQYNYNRDCAESKQNKGVFISDTDSLVTKMYAEYYARDADMALSQRDYDNIIAPLADLYAAKSHWDKIFVLLPNNTFVDDHTRYMKHGSINARWDLAHILLRDLQDIPGANIETLDGDYQSNFNRVKQYIQSIGGK